MKACVVIASLAVAAGSLDGLAAQSLDDIARREAERRKQTTPGKQYTNADLRADPQPAPSQTQAPPSVAPASSSEAATSSPPAAAAGSPAPAAEATAVAAGREKRDEGYWRTRARELRDRVQQLRDQIEALDARVAELDAQRQAGAAPSVGREHDVAAATLGRLRRNLQSFSEEIQRFEERARLQNVPAEWIR